MSIRVTPPGKGLDTGHSWSRGYQQTPDLLWEVDTQVLTLGGTRETDRRMGDRRTLVSPAAVPCESSPRVTGDGLQRVVTRTWGLGSTAAAPCLGGLWVRVGWGSGLWSCGEPRVCGASSRVGASVTGVALTPSCVTLMLWVPCAPLDPAVPSLLTHLTPGVLSSLTPRPVPRSIRPREVGSSSGCSGVLLSSPAVPGKQLGKRPFLVRQNWRKPPHQWMMRKDKYTFSGVFKLP